MKNRDEEAYREGQKSFLTENANPYFPGTIEYDSWDDGWNQQEKIWADWLNSCGGTYS